MEFLDPKYKHIDIMLLDIYYYSGTWSNSDDILYVLFKEVDTEIKRMVEIPAPDIEIQVIKKEYRNRPDVFDPRYIHDWVRKDLCETHRVNFKNRYAEAAKILGVSQSEVKQSPYLFNFDIGIERWYLHQFLKEYQTSKLFEITAGFYDIETDIINCPTFPEYGTVPISCVTYIDSPSMTSYTLIYHNCAIDKSNPRYEELSTKYEKDYAYFCDHIEDFVNECHNDFDESYGRLEYIIMTFENELEMIKAFFSLVSECKNDYSAAWNAPFDFGNLVTRPSELGVDLASVLPNDNSDHLTVAFKEDRQFNPVKCRHLMFTSAINTVWTDARVNYAAIRSQRGKLPSTRLNYIAQIELNDEKLDYSEETDIKHFMYENFWKFIKYNIKDVLLLLGIESKNRDLVDVTSRISAHGLPPRDVFGSLAMEDSSIIRYMDSYTRNDGVGYYVGLNRAKLGLNDFVYEPDGIDSDDSNDDDADEFEFDDSSDDDDNGPAYDGAVVLNPLHMQPSGFSINNTLKKFIHDHLIDMDITAEYPTAAIIQNASNETFLGKIMFPEKIKEVPIYQNFRFADEKEAADYSLDPNTFIMELYQQKQYGLIGQFVLNLPSTDELIEMIESEGVDIYGD